MEISLKSPSDDAGKLLLRLAVGGLMLFHGVSKLIHGIGWLMGMLNGMGLPGFIALGVYVGEVVGPILLIFGFKTRLAALVVAFDMLMAVLMVLRNQIFSVREMGGGWSIELEAFFFLGAIAIFYLGAGKYSVSRGQGPWD